MPLSTTGRRIPAEVHPTTGLALSLVVPAFDEEENLELLHARVAIALGPGADWELVLVDDGSRDGTGAVIRALVARDERVLGVFLPSRAGQSAALRAGIDQARGSVIATLDADLQNDPADIALLLGHLDGHDAVVGYRARRRDTLARRVSSRIANALRNWISRDHIRDTGCGLKVFRASALETIPWFDGVHRFLPTLLRYQGLRVVEVPVSHHPRHAGRSKYGIRNRAVRAFLDLLAVRWMRARLLHPGTEEVLRAR